MSVFPHTHIPSLHHFLTPLSTFPHIFTLSSHPHTPSHPQVHVEFNSDSDRIILEGPPAEVQQAKESFESFTEDLVHTLCVYAMQWNLTNPSL